MAIPAIISCSLCSGVRRLAITVTCCGAGTCKSCAVKHITSSRACWACQAALTTKDVISDELLRKKIDELSDSSLLLCGVCAEMCKRGVSAPCCQAKACRSCAVKVVTGTRACWECRKPIEETGKLVNDELLRAAVEQFKECGVMDPEHWDKLAVTKEPEKDEVGEVESGGQGNDTSITSESVHDQDILSCSLNSGERLLLEEGEISMESAEKEETTVAQQQKEASDTKPKRDFSPIRPPLRQVVNIDWSSLRDSRGRGRGGYGGGRGGYGGGRGGYGGGRGGYGGGRGGYGGGGRGPGVYGGR